MDVSVVLLTRHGACFASVLANFPLDTWTEATNRLKQQSLNAPKCVEVFLSSTMALALYVAPLLLLVCIGMYLLASALSSVLSAVVFSLQSILVFCVLLVPYSVVTAAVSVCLSVSVCLVYLYTRMCMCICTCSRILFFPQTMSGCPFTNEGLITACATGVATDPAAAAVDAACTATGYQDEPADFYLDLPYDQHHTTGSGNQQAQQLDEDDALLEHNVQQQERPPQRLRKLCLAWCQGVRATGLLALVRSGRLGRHTRALDLTGLGSVEDGHVEKLLAGVPRLQVNDAVCPVPSCRV